MHVGALYDCHVVVMLLTCGCILVFVVVMFIMLLSFGALDDCQVVVILLSCWCMLTILLSFVAIWCIL